MKKQNIRIPLPKKTEQVHKDKSKYNRKREKEKLRKTLNEENEK